LNETYKVGCSKIFLCCFSPSVSIWEWICYVSWLHNHI